MGEVRGINFQHHFHWNRPVRANDFPQWQSMPSKWGGVSIVDTPKWVTSQHGEMGVRARTDSQNGILFSDHFYLTWRFISQSSSKKTFIPNLSISTCFSPRNSRWTTYVGWLFYHWCLASSHRPVQHSPQLSRTIRTDFPRSSNLLTLSSFGVPLPMSI